mmetsp:Transcript_33855/g.46873  ORF Transcript_33855/g.46873 Transcript_33855/m.46873 type:complete len:323 (+) Transcript_33855:505-1473(+)
MNTRPQAVIWDIDGTLAATTQLGFTATNAVLKKFGFSEIGEAEYLRGTIYTTPERLAWHASGGLDGGDISAPCGEELGRAFDEYYVELVSFDTAGFYPGLNDLCLELASLNILQGAVSNACGSYVVRVLDVNGVSSLFPSTLGADQAPRAKPHPDGLLLCAASLGVDPAQCVYVGDAPSDGQAAKAAGMLALGVTWGSHGGEAWRANFETVCDDASQLRAALGLKLGMGLGARKQSGEMDLVDSTIQASVDKEMKRKTTLKAHSSIQFPTKGSILFRCSRNTKRYVTSKVATLKLYSQRELASSIVMKTSIGFRSVRVKILA